MTEYELKVPGQLLSSLLSEKNGLAELLEAILNPILDGFPISRRSSLSISKWLAHKFYYSIHNAYRYSTSYI